LSQSNNERFAIAVQHLTEGLALWDADGKLVLWNSHYHEMSESAAAELTPGLSYEDWMRIQIRHGVIPEAMGREEEWVVGILENFKDPEAIPEIMRNGRWRQIRWQKLPDGSTLSFVVDIHDMKMSEEQLQHSQRLKAVGQLTGGIAHDFNNLLAAQIGYVELLESRVEHDETALRYVEAIKKAVDRGASLTHRLLSFSRQQALSPETMDVNGLVRELEEMFRRTLGETIDLTLDLSPGVCPAVIDSHKFEDALLNLAINARDAMPIGGTLKIETTNIVLDEAYTDHQEEVAPGNYVEIKVSDNGIGMPPEVIRLAIEPFFTTKEIGAGSGLGLSMVYGFAKQSNGHLTIDSEPDRGTTVRLYVPQSAEEEKPENVKNGEAAPAPGSGHILVVEDDPAVRKVTLEILHKQGFEATEAVNGEEALALLKGKKKFDLLFTDVILPGGMNGFEIAQEAILIQPNLKILYTTGYADNAIPDSGQSDLSIIQKPFTRNDLLAQIRNILAD